MEDINKKALITGITGQDGSYLAKFLLNKNYDVYGIIRRASTINTERLDDVYQDPHTPHPRLHLIYGDMADSSTIGKIIEEVMPDEIYNLAAQSHVRVSFDIPEYTGDIVGLGATRILEVIRRIKDKTGRSIKFYQASSSEMFGNTIESPQKETTPFYPQSPYGIAKLYAYWITKNYRESYGIYACNGLLFNHTSKLRGKTFVTKKITMAVAAIKEGTQDILYLGNLDAKRDWGHAQDYVKAMWLMLQQSEPDDYVISTGENHTVREFLEKAFAIAGIPVIRNRDEYIRKDNKKVVVKIDTRYFRPSEVNELLGDYTKAKIKLGWNPQIKFDDIIKEMVEYDSKELKEKLYGVKNGK